MLEWEGVKIGLMGLAEGDWVDTLSAVEPEDVTYLDFVEEGRGLAKKLRVRRCHKG
jgi:5'-nucleotidase